MVAPIYSNKRGIYKDLYREIESDKNKKKKAENTHLARKPKKGIYVELYRQIEFKNNERKNNSNNLYILAFKKFINDVSSSIARFFSSATGEVKMLIVAYMVAKKPINSYIENNWDINQNSIQ